MIRFNLQLFGGRGSAGGNNPAGSKAIREARALANKPVAQRTASGRSSSQSKRAQQGARQAQELATRTENTRNAVRSARELANQPEENRTAVNRTSQSAAEVRKKVQQAQRAARR